VPRRANYRGRRVVFPLGVILLATAGFALTAGLNRWLVFLCGVGYLGLIDDLIGNPTRGLRGHGIAVARGELSTGALKAAGTLALAAYAAAGDEVSAATYGAEVLVLALAAHVGNLLDTRPGRSEKALGLIATIVCVASWSLAPLGPIAPLLPVVAVCAWLTLSERAMLGDTGASLIGGMIGVLLVTALSAVGVALALVGLIAISLYGEFRSISAAIERVPLLYRLDSLGRVN
jgi:UDP-N-acetylmuramyl pentapeptide phosphotransferase/UDP-N-acetylglucosamine-1-phosphate transferase